MIEQPPEVETRMNLFRSLDEAADARLKGRVLRIAVALASTILAFAALLSGHGVLRISQMADRPRWILFPVHHGKTHARVVTHGPLPRQRRFPAGEFRASRCGKSAPSG